MTSNFRRFTSGTSSSNVRLPETRLCQRRTWAASVIRCQLRRHEPSAAKQVRDAQRSRWSIRRRKLLDAAVHWPKTDTRFSQLTEIRSDVYSKYHALVLQANRRLTAGLQFQTNYTLSRASTMVKASVTFTQTTCRSMRSISHRKDGLSNFRPQTEVCSQRCLQPQLLSVMVRPSTSSMAGLWLRS